MFLNSLLGLILVLLLILTLKLHKEHFTGNVFGYSSIPSCNAKDNCFQGHPVRFTMYENMCEPENLDACGNVYRGEDLLRAPRQLRDTCIRGFKN
jgi:hypothetical protein